MIIGRSGPAWAFAALVAAVAQLSGPPSTARDQAETSAAVPVTVEKEGDRYRLFRGGEPYEVRGAGVEYGDIRALAAHGANSLRTWRTTDPRAPAGRVLDEAAANGLTVAMCIEIGRERLGFDYADEAAVARQFEHARGEVLKYKDHPALLVWIIGNELNLNSSNPRVFDAVNDISEMIHEVDGQHPTTTALAGFSGELAKLVENRAPDLDFISIQMYGDLVNLPRKLAQIGYQRPYLVTEWGATGHWEVPKTPWGAPIEQNSTEKARNYLRSYETAIASDPRRILGSYVFKWGHKQERTPTWYGMFLSDGSATEAVDVMHYIWNGRWPDDRAPRVERMTFDAKSARDGVVLAAGEKYVGRVVASDPEGGNLHYRWEVMNESDATEEGGDPEEVPHKLSLEIDSRPNGVATVTTPTRPGAYRLFVYVYDETGRGAHANIPFLVE